MKFKDIKNSSFYVTPNFPSMEMKRYKYSFFTILGYLLGLILSISVVLILLFSFTPMKKMLYWIENTELETQQTKIVQLEEQVILLSRELSKVTTLDKRINYAMILAATDSLDSSAAIYDSLRSEPIKNKMDDGGYILKLFEKAIFRIFGAAQKVDSTKLFFISPIKKGIISNRFAPNKNHLGIDFALKQNSQVYAPANGYVIFAGFTAKDGSVLIIQNKDDYRTVFKHCNSLLKKEGEFVHQGELIALSGNSGYNTTGPHLHFEIWHKNTPLDPQKFIYFE